VARNPFDDSALAVGYEAWYETEGRTAEEEERALLSRLMAAWPGGRTALEIGTGTGHFARWLSGMNWHMIGLDISAPMLREAARRDILSLVRADANALPFAAHTFDVALLITTLEFLPDPGRALRDAARVARCGIVLGVLNRWHWLAWERKRSGLPLWRAAHFYSPPELARQVRQVLGNRVDRISWQTTPLLGCRWERLLRLPLGAFIGMCVRLSEKEQDDRAD